MVGAISRESYFDTGLEVLSDVGYGGLKLAVVCDRLGVTTGSFYHYFPSWSAYTGDLLNHWADVRRLSIAKEGAPSDPRRRLDNFLQTALGLPHGAEAAIRVWSAIDSDVRAVQSDVDALRYQVLFDAAFEILHHKDQAQVFASWAMYMLIGYEQSTLPCSRAHLEWIADQMAGHAGRRRLRLGSGCGLSPV